MAQPDLTTREVPLDPDRSALLSIDLQNFSARSDGGEFAGLTPAEMEKHARSFDRIERMAPPNMQALLAAFRSAGREVMYTTIESLTKDGRDRGRDHKITGVKVPKGSWDGRVLDATAPGEDESVLSESSSVFVSTHVDCILRNLDVTQPVLCVFLTDQCAEPAVRYACDPGCLVTLVPDACATCTPDRHDNTLRANRGHCRQVSTADLIAEIAAPSRGEG